MSRRWWTVVILTAVAAAIGATYAMARGSDGPPGPSGAPDTPSASNLPPITWMGGQGAQAPDRAATKVKCKGIWAAMEYDGTLNYGCGVANWGRYYAGVYGVQFRKNVWNCVPEVTAGYNHTGSLPNGGAANYFWVDQHTIGVAIAWQSPAVWFDQDFSVTMTC